MKAEGASKLGLTKVMARRLAAMLVVSMILGISTFTNYAVKTELKMSPGTLPGDVDGDGEVRLKDAQMALRSSLRIVRLTEEQLKRVNVDDKEDFTDGDINLALVQKILKIALGITVSTPWPTDSSEPPVESEEPNFLERWGLGKVETKHVSLNRDYDWYVDQAHTGWNSVNNCAPSCAEMAGRWSDSNFSLTAEAVRNMFSGTLGVPYAMIYEYVFIPNEIPCRLMYNWEGDAIPDLPIENQQVLTEQRVKNYIDNNQIIMICIDKELMPYHSVPGQRIGKLDNNNYTHAIIIKGYRVVDGKTYFEVYDPASRDRTYSDGSLIGIDRYHLASEVLNALLSDYIVVSEKANER